MQSNKGKFRIGLIGLGQMGRNHLRVLSLLKGVEIKFIYDLDLAILKEMSKIFEVPAIKNLRGVWPIADAVIICSPTSTHSAMLRMASKHVKNIFVEKPLSHSLECTRSDLEFIKNNNLNVQVGFIERFNPAVQKLKSVLEQSEQVVNIDFTRTNRLSSRIKDVDVVTDLMIHDIDLAIYLNGPVKIVTAQGMIENGMVALASAHLVHGNGRLSRIHSSRITERKIRKIQATCIDCFVDCDLLRKELLIHRQSETETDSKEIYSINSIEQAVQVKQQEPLLTEIQSFLAFCHNRNNQIPTPNDAFNAADICEKVLREIVD
ncbi:Gfo/Idh/MocA family oxidoreductase [Paracoccaceae bacterium]|nr:Gfo/Idh/MocA family oxidoreductase [Paracoccaceae bacterium]